jgi:anti-sigma B factor antagonist
MTFEITTTEDGVVRLAIKGELDAACVPELRPTVDGLVEQRPPRLEVELSALRVIDSSGVGTLVSLYKRVRAYGGQMTVVGLRDQPLAIFKLLRLDRVMTGG